MLSLQLLSVKGLGRITALQLLMALVALVKTGSTIASYFVNGNRIDLSGASSTFVSGSCRCG